MQKKSLLPKHAAIALPPPPNFNVDRCDIQGVQRPSKKKACLCKVTILGSSINIEIGGAGVSNDFQHKVANRLFFCKHRSQIFTFDTISIISVCNFGSRGLSVFIPDRKGCLHPTTVLKAKGRSTKIQPEIFPKVLKSELSTFQSLIFVIF